ncbi:hypothetical protein BX600DRAFT_464377 [Xylariales sp. PMI_506]|nr:hypothetical protein BX600DRAFT_464377 [Xylariales sp. PMI_506]
MAASSKPHLLITAFPLAGHTTPLLKIAAALIQRGYEVTFVGGKDFEHAIVKIGAEFVATPGIAELVAPDWFAQRELRAIGYDRVLYDHQTIFMSGVPAKAQILGDTLEKIRERDPTRQVVVLAETLNQGIMPFFFGRPPPKGYDAFPKVIGVHAMPLFLQGIDVAPFLMGLPFDSTESGRLRNQALTKLYNETPYVKSLIEGYNAKYEEAGAHDFPTTGFPADLWLTKLDVTVQVCSPSLEYPRTDMPSNIVFTGCLPLSVPPPDYKYPEWWPEITENAGKKKIVFVAQGTVAMNLAELIMPTIEALKDRDDVLVVTTLGRPGATLPEGVEAPSNLRVADFLLYDAILPYADVFISNAGYGAVTQSVIAGVPMVLAGESEDKLEAILRFSRAGVAVDIKTQTPSAEQIRRGIEEVLSNGKYKARALELKKESEDMDAIAVIESQIAKISV